jgi:outer membrane receptor protein involved in Fe transport
LTNCNPATGGVVKPSLHVDDEIGNVGGPVIKDKLFFYAAYEHLKRSYPQPNTISSATKTALEGLGESASDFNTAPTVQHAQWFDTRIDAAINKKNQLFIRYNYFRNVYPFNSNVGGQYAISAAADFQDRAHIIGAQLITTFSPNMFNEFRGSWPYRNERHVADALTGPGPMITISGIANFGGSNSVGDKFQEKIPSFNDNLTWIKGKHEIKFGFGMQQNLDTQFADIFTQYTFASIAQYQSALNGTSPQVYSSVSTSIGNPGAAYHSLFFDLFGQDAWQLRKNLLVTYGVRYDQYRAPTPPANEPFFYTDSFRTPEGDFSPRLGVSYQPYSKTVVRLNAGVFYEAPPTNTWYNPLYNNGRLTGSFITTIAGSSTPGPCQPVFPNSPESLPSGCVPTQSIYALNPHFKDEYVWNANLQVAQQIAKNDSLTVGYIMTLGRNMQFLRNLNLLNTTPIGYLADGRPIYGVARQYTTLSNGAPVNNITYEDIGSNSSYSALTATYEHRLSAGLTTSASYTWAHAISNTPEANTFELSTPVEDTSTPNRDRGNSGINRPDAFTISLVYAPNTHFDNHILNSVITNNTFAMLGNMSSGDEQSITVSPKLNGDAIATSRPLYVGRDTARAPAVYQFDFRYTRTLATLFHKVQPRLLIEGTNLFNRSNVTSINTTATVVTAAGDSRGPIGTIITPPTLLPIGSVLEARILQFGMKLDF